MRRHLEGWEPLPPQRIIMARSWGALALEPVEALYQCLPGERIGAVFGVVTLAVNYGLARDTGGTRIVVPTLFRSGALSAFLVDAKRLCRREVAEASLQEDAGARATYRWLDQDEAIHKSAARAITGARNGDDPVLVVRFEHGDLPVWRPRTRHDRSLPPRPWWLERLPDVDDAVSVNIRNLLATPAQLEGVVAAVAHLIEASGRRRI